MSEQQSNAFNPEQFAAMTITDSNSTTLPLIPEGEYQGYIKSGAFKQNPKTGFPIYEATIVVDDPRAREATGMQEPTARFAAFIDLANGNLDMSEGKNVNLGQLREATGLNKAGQPFSFNMFAGKPLQFKIVHKDGFANVKNVAPLG